jgi:SAM-dependent methyltransferase
VQIDLEERGLKIGDANPYQGRSAQLLSRLRCPECRGTMICSPSDFSCSVCSKTFPIRDGVAHFAPAESYASSFGFQWTQYARTQLDTDSTHVSEINFLARTGFRPDQLHGKWVLDVGCGMGRFAEVVSRWGANVVGIDLSRAALVAARNLAARDNVFILRGDLFKLPFAFNSFDFIYSIGVLHHTPDCRAAFMALPQYLAPSGSIAVWLYSAYNKWYRMSDVYRRVTSRMSPQALHALCRVAGPLYFVQEGLKRIPLIGRPMSGVLQYALPISQFPNWEWRVLDTFDWYSPTYQSKHTYEEVFRWFEDAGLGDLHVGNEPIAVRGTKAGAVASHGREQNAGGVQRAGT